MDKGVYGHSVPVTIFVTLSWWSAESVSSASIIGARNGTASGLGEHFLKPCGTRCGSLLILTGAVQSRQ